MLDSRFEIALEDRSILFPRCKFYGRISSLVPFQRLGIPSHDLAYCSLGVEPAAEDIKDRPPSNGKSGILTKEFFIDVVAYGMLMGIPPLISFVIVVYAVGRDHIGTDCGDIMDPGCGIVYRARACVFLSLTILILLHAFEMKDFYESIFRMRLLRNKTLFFSVVGGIGVLISTLYIPTLNEVVFKMWAISWECALCLGSIIFYLIGAESYKALKRRLRSRPRRLAI